ncbi:SirB1 family protein [Vibrio maerlii]|uniref:SirB1 family protein n=1 Tax=Vibrio maerlii TaxID=2231648 RepID=UPI000E3CC26A|nr:SirB1 family protein [Vibrio maerlii]
MIDMFDEDFDSLPLAEGALILNHAIDESTQVDWAKQEMARLFAELELELVHERDDKQRLASFLRIFYHQWGFKGDTTAYYRSENAFIDKVLESRKGIPVSLGALLLYFGRQLGLPLEGIAFPTQFVVRANWDDEIEYINPFNGEYVSEHTLRAWLIGSDGPLVTLKEEHLEVTDNPTVIGRWLALLKSTLLNEEKYLLALKCTDLALNFIPDDPYEIRDRGFIYQQLDCTNIAISDYEYFIEQCPEDPAAELLKGQVSKMSEDSAVVVH